MSRWFVVLVLAASAARAEGVALSLQEFLASAEQRAFDNRTARANDAKAAADYATAWSSLLPYITIQGGYTRNQYETSITIPGTSPPTVALIAPLNQWDGTFRVDLPIIYASMWLRAKGAGHARESAQERIASTRDFVQRQVVAAFYSYAGASAVLEAATRALTVSKAQLANVEARFNAGTVTELDVLRARAEVQQNLQSVANTEAQVVTTKLALETLSGTRAGPGIKLPKDDLSSEEEPKELVERVQLLPSIRATKLDVNAARATKTGAWLALVPYIGVSATERLTNAVGLQNRSAFYLLQATLNWRIDVPTFTAARSAGATAEIASIQAERAEAAARDQVYQESARLQSAVASLSAASAQVEAARRAQTITQDRYVLGAVTQLDAISAERDLFQAEVRFIQARADLGLARASLRLSTARPIFKKE